MLKGSIRSDSIDMIQAVIKGDNERAQIPLLIQPVHLVITSILVREP